MSSTDAWTHRIKAAQRDLIACCGGIDRAARIASVSVSTMGRFNAHGQPDLMPLAVVVALEAECGEPAVTQALAGISGRRLSDPEAERVAAQDLTGSFAAQFAAQAASMQHFAASIADGHWSRAELLEAQRIGGEVMNSTSKSLGAIATALSMGGVKAELKLVGEG